MPSLPEPRRALVNSEREIIVGMYEHLATPIERWDKPKTSAELVIQNTIRRAASPDDRFGHHWAKLIWDRMVPQRKQVEHLGDSDARNMGVNINILAEGKKHGHEREPIEHEPVGRGQSHRDPDERGSTEEQSATVILSGEDGGSQSG